ncbi:Clp protease N-terminal domain-containing protein [Actinomycetospora sp.]|jgi:ATP-dependent Clp protease ATP-binding subunit ClpC|uniref:Clp protease N-terminal domain-containing protein n=1 Tax=Actinomycetospora sp. TaxID=1872135 RepID=UPI002F3FE333
MRLTHRQTARFTRAVQLARREAMALAAPALGTEHLLLGLAREERESGRGPLEPVDPDDLRALLPRSHPAPEAESPPFSRRAIAALAEARRLADARGDLVVGADHLLAAVAGDPDCAAVAALERLGVDVGDVWSLAVADLGRDRGPRPFVDLFR